MRGLADYFLSYPKFDGGELVGTGWGPQPYEGILSSLCDAFPGALPRPGGIEAQDWREMKAILDYRAARDATDIQKGRRGDVMLDDYPELAEIMDEMRAAQNE